LKNAYKILVEKSQGNFEYTEKRNDTIEINLRDIGLQAWTGFSSLRAGYAGGIHNFTII
jgi:hypothetical protein